MGLFTQEINLKLKNDNSVIEKQTVELKKRKIDVNVQGNCVAIFSGEKLTSGLHKFSKKVFGDNVDVLIYQDGKKFDTISFNFTTGEYTVSLDTLEGAKAKYCLNGTTSCEIYNYEKLAKYFNRTITREDLIEELQNSVRDSFATEVRAVASKYITANSTVNSIYLDLDNIRKEIAKRDFPAINKLLQMGLDLSSSGIALKLTAVDETEDLVDKVNNKINQNALDALDQVKKDKLREQRLEEKQIDQEHEVNVIRAQNTTITETKIDSNGYNPVTINKTEASRFCTNCGEKLSLDTKFCPKCGKEAK